MPEGYFFSNVRDVLMYAGSDRRVSINYCKKCNTELPRANVYHHFAVKNNEPWFELIALFACSSCESLWYKVLMSRPAINLDKKLEDEPEKESKKKK